MLGLAIILPAVFNFDKHHTHKFIKCHDRINQSLKKVLINYLI